MTKRRRRAILALLVGVLLVLVGDLWIRWHQAPPQGGPVVAGNYPSPGSSNFTGYRVKVTEIGIDLPIVEGDGWTVPYFRAAHYPGTAVPGQGGRSMLYAHAQAGMFGPLLHDTAAVGQHVVVERPGMPALRYVITSYYPAWPPGDLKFTRPTDHEELVLLTCTSYNPNDPRIIAVAVPA